MSKRPAPPPVIHLDSPGKKPYVSKPDPRKFSKLLVNHCISKGFLIPPVEFLQDLDGFANGEITQDDIEKAHKGGEEEYFIPDESPPPTQPTDYEDLS